MQELEAGSGYTASTMTAATGQSIVEVTGGSTADGVFHGLVYTPNSEFRFDNSSNSATQQLLGGAAVARMSVQASSSATGFKIAVATTPSAGQDRDDRQVGDLRRSDDIGTGESSTTGRTRSNPANRVAINSLRVLD